MIRKIVQSGARDPIPVRILTGLVAATVILLLAGQLDHSADEATKAGVHYQERDVPLALWQTSRRATNLKNITNAADREMMCIPIAYVARRMDQDIPRGARLFMDGVLGTNRAPERGMYFFLRNYLFPREIEISMDSRVVIKGTDFEGIPYTSEAELRSNGFDALISFTNGDVLLTPLTYTNRAR